MLRQYHYDLTPRQAQELIWSRFVSTKSAPGHNIPEDLHQEHLNRVITESIKGLRANKTEVAVTRVGKALGTLYPVLDNFDSDNSVRKPSGSHKVPSWTKDRDVIIDCLIQSNIFSVVPNRCHPTFKNPKDVLHSTGKDDLIDWIQKHLRDNQ